MKRTEKRNKRTKLSLMLKVFAIFAASFLICATAYGIYLTKKAEHAANQSYEELDRQSSSKRDTKAEALSDNISILFIGVDDSEVRAQGSDHSRSDALMLMTLNRKEKSVKLLSIPRDSYVYIPDVGYEDKITHAHAFGGTQATIETVEELLDVPVDYYVRMNFNAFIEVVDALGGIDLDVNIPYAFYEKDENDQYSIYLEPGYHHLNGREALALARTRKHDTDIARGVRQQDILKAIAKKALSVSSISKYDDVIVAIGDNMKTNLTFDDMKALLAYFSGGMPQIDTLTLQGEGDMSTGIYYYKLDEESLEETKQILQTHLGIIPGKSSSNISEIGSEDEEYNDSYSYSPASNWNQ
ncbi:LCP family protein [Ureibacillus terrenus]|uniref:LytR family transcriptional regulator n=1 Tax=Ureibacillus terrenus TaxID=118246 RepID=A0A540V3X1_9BACL|nr:LCP family protein [Ureibacillus terrenus]MED3660935.1 LCP family protein [Ureibacillus terrenus]MED3763053.1 LCP family protein [Ureibacillus terrenus]TQE91431.1 LytR family transcriptional regulator [Ureibacillus terrenus]